MKELCVELERKINTALVLVFSNFPQSITYQYQINTPVLYFKPRCTHVYLQVVSVYVA